MLGAIGGTTERWVVVGAHYDASGWEIPGANDNAAGVSIVLEVARRLRDADLDLSILVAFFDAEEPPHFLTPYMGSQWFVDHPTISLDQVDTMVCLDLVGHVLGPASLPDAIRDSVFVLGAEKGSGTPEPFDSLPTVDGIIPRRVDNYIVPAMSDYYAFMNESIPFLFYTCGRNVDYHMPTDTPDKLDYSKMAALVDHLTLLLGKLGRRPDRPSYVHGGVDDESTVRTMSELTEALRPYASEADHVASLVEGWRETLLRDGSLSQQDRQAVAYVVFQVEEALA
ncbi:MAG: M28 family metallopeptidase [Actinomycetota bacterium]